MKMYRVDIDNSNGNSINDTNRINKRSSPFLILHHHHCHHHHEGRRAGILILLVWLLLRLRGMEERRRGTRVQCLFDACSLTDVRNRDTLFPLLFPRFPTLSLRGWVELLCFFFVRVAFELWNSVNLFFSQGTLYIHAFHLPTSPFFLSFPFLLFFRKTKGLSNFLIWSSSRVHRTTVFCMYVCTTRKSTRQLEFSVTKDGITQYHRPLELQLSIELIYLYNILYGGK